MRVSISMENRSRWTDRCCPPRDAAFFNIPFGLGLEAERRGSRGGRSSVGCDIVPLVTLILLLRRQIRLYGEEGRE